MKVRLSIYILLFFSISFFADETIIKEKVETILPKGAEIESIVQSEFPGIYKVYYGHNKLYKYLEIQIEQLIQFQHLLEELFQLFL